MMDRRFLTLCIWLLAVFYFNSEVIAQSQVSGGGSVSVGGATVSAEGSAGTDDAQESGSVSESTDGAEPPTDGDVSADSNVSPEIDLSGPDPTAWTLTLLNMTEMENQYLGVEGQPPAYQLRAKENMGRHFFDVYFNFVIWKSNSPTFSDIDNTTVPIYNHGICNVLDPAKRKKEDISDESVAVGIVSMTFTDQDNCIIEAGVRSVVPTQTLQVIESKNPDFNLPADRNWYMRIHYLHYAGHAYDDYYIRADYSVLASYDV